MTSVKHEGPPDGPRDQAMWPLVVAVAVSAGIIGYLFGATSPPGGPPGIRADRGVTTGPAPTLPTATAPPDPGTPPAEEAPPALALRDLVPGLEGVMVAVIGSHFESEVVRWPAGRADPVRHPLPARMFLVEPDARGHRFAALQSSAQGAPVLHAGLPDSLLPVAFDVASFAWHGSAARRLAWVERTEDAATSRLRTGELDIVEPFLSRVTTIGAVPTTDRLITWGEWGFLLGHGDDMYLVDHEGVERWRVEASEATATAQGRLLLHGWDRDGWPPSAIDVVVADPAVDETPPSAVEWFPANAVPIGMSPDGERLALLAAGERLEIWDLQGRPLLSIEVPGWMHAPDVSWSADGRFIVGPLQAVHGSPTRTAAFFDTWEGTIHEIGFRAWVWGRVAVVDSSPPAPRSTRSSAGSAPIAVAR